MVFFYFVLFLGVVVRGVLSACIQRVIVVVILIGISDPFTSPDNCLLFFRCYITTNLSIKGSAA